MLYVSIKKIKLRRFFMNYLKSIGFGFLLAFIAGCIPVPGGNGGFFPPQAPRNYNEIKRNDEDREIVINKAKLRGRACEEEDDNHKCYDNCRELYSRNDRDECEELPPVQIEQLVYVHELLKDPDEDELEKIEARDLDIYLNISIKPFDLHAKKYRSREAEDILVWIIQKEDIAKIIEKEDDDYKFLQTILNTLERFDSNNVHEPFTNSVNGQTLIELAVHHDNEIALEWFQKYVFDTSRNCENDEDDLTCFAVFCRIGESMDRRDGLREDWISYDYFERYIDGLIKNKTNANDYDAVDNKPAFNDKDSCEGDTLNKTDCWNSNNLRGVDFIEDIKDLNDGWFNELCKGINY